MTHFTSVDVPCESTPVQSSGRRESRSILVPLVLALVGCAAPPAAREPSAPSPPKVPNPQAHSPAAPVARFDAVSFAAAIRPKGHEEVSIDVDKKGRLRTMRYKQVLPAAFVRDEEGAPHVHAFVSEFGERFGYGRLGEAGEKRLIVTEELHTVLVTYPKAEGCPGLTVTLTYEPATEGGAMLGMPSEWTLLCPADTEAAVALADLNSRYDVHAEEGLRERASAQKGPVGQWLWQSGYGTLSHYDDTRGVIRLELQSQANGKTGEALTLAREMAKGIATILKLPALDRERVGYFESPSQGSSKRPSEESRLVRAVRFSMTEVPANGPYADPSILIELEHPKAGNTTYATSVTLDLELASKGPMPPPDSARALPKSFSTSPNILYSCHWYGGMGLGDRSTVVDRRGDVYSFAGSASETTEASFARAMRRNRSFNGTMDPAEVDTMVALLPTLEAAKKKPVGRVDPRSVVADAGSIDCLFYRRGPKPGTLIPIPAQMRSAGTTLQSSRSVEETASRFMLRAQSLSLRSNGS
jgi:hypothetical protein